MNLKRLLSPDAAEGASAGTTAATAEATAEELESAEMLNEPTEQGGESTTQEGEGAGETAAAPTTETAAPVAASPAVTAADIEQILSRVIPLATARQDAPPKNEPERQYTQEEYDRMFNVFKPSEALITRMRSEDPKEALAAINELHQGLIKQAMTLTEYRIRQIRDSLIQEHVQPLQVYVTEQQATSFRNDFFKLNPDLEPYETIVDAVANKLAQTGHKAASRADLMKRYADDTKAVVESLLAKGNGAGNGTAAAGKTASGTPAPGVKRMSTLTGGGQGGSSRGTSQASPKGPSGIEIFD